jgi:hypothetical protein
MLPFRDPGAVDTEAPRGGEDMRRLVLLIVLTMAALPMLPRAAAAAADASVTGTQWWVYPRLNKQTFQRDETARVRYGVYVYVSPMDVASSARLSSELQVRRHYTRSSRWRCAHTRSPNVPAATPELVPAALPPRGKGEVVVDGHERLAGCQVNIVAPSRSVRLQVRQ